MVNLKIPKLKFPKMGKRRKRILMISLIALALVVSTSYMLNPNPLNLRNIFDYSDVEYIVQPLGTELTEGDTVQAQLHDIRVVLTWDNDVSPNNPSKLRCTLKGGNFVEGDWVSWTGNDVYTWTFELSGAATGTNIHHFEFTGYYPTIDNPEWTYEGNSFSFYIHNLIQVVDPPQITSRPDDILMPNDESRTIVWQYQYNALSTITLTMDGTELKKQAGLKSISNQTFSYTFNPTEIGIYSFTFSLDPENILHPTVSDIVVVTVISAEEYYMVDGIPDDLESVEVAVRGTMTVLGLNLVTGWSEPTSDVPSDVYNFPRQGELTIDVLTMTKGILPNFVAFGELKLIMSQTGQVDRVFYFDEVNAEDLTPDILDILGFLFPWMSYVEAIEVMEEVTVNLNSIDAGEYDCEIRGEYGGVWYRISTFKIAANTFPFGAIAGLSGYFILIGILSIVSIVALRRFREWWGFKGRYK